MINFICGKVVNISDGLIVLQSGDIGYELAVSSNTLSKCQIGQNIQLFCRLIIKEDGAALFGFFSAEEKNMFCRLTGVSGIGPKTALAILSGITPQGLGVAILNSDTAALNRIKGIGKKSAERIVLELREGMESFVRGGGELEINSSMHFVPVISAAVAEAVSILRTLGLTASAAQAKAQAAADAGAKSTEDILQAVLKNY